MQNCGRKSAERAPGQGAGLGGDRRGGKEEDARSGELPCSLLSRGLQAVLKFDGETQIPDNWQAWKTERGF